MAGISLGSNISSLTAQRRLSESSSAMGRSLERLSSGLRINRASDDAAGLSIASSLKLNSRVYTQGIRNLNDGQSLLAIADSTVGSLTEIVTRIKELAQQSANGTFSVKQRASLDQEAQALAKEYYRVARSADFNGLKIFDGTVSSLRVQAGFGASGGIQSGLGGVFGAGAFLPGKAYSTNPSANAIGVSLADFNYDGNLDLVTANDSDGTMTIGLGNGDGTFGVRRTYTMLSGARAVISGDFNGDGLLDVVAGGTNGYSNGLIAIRLGNGDGTFRIARTFAGEQEGVHALTSGDLNGDGALDLVSAGYTAGPDGAVTIRLGNGDGSFKFGKIYLSNEDLPKSVALGDVDGDGILDLVSGGAYGAFRATIRLGNGDGTFKSARSDAPTLSGWSTGVRLGDVNGDGNLDVLSVSYDGSESYLDVALGNGNGSFTKATSYSTRLQRLGVNLALGDFNGDGFYDAVTGGYDSTSFSLLLNDRARMRAG